MSSRDYQECKCGHAMYQHAHPVQGDKKPRVYGECQCLTARGPCLCPKFRPKEESK